MIRYDKNDLTLANVAAAFQKRLKAPMDVTLVIDPSLGKATGKWEGGVASASSYDQLYDVLGRLLRNPALPEGTYKSVKEFCTIYFASHFNNYMDMAPMDELCEYIVDLAFWGMSAINIWFDMHFFRNPEEGRVKIDRLREAFKFARKMGILTILTTLSNEAWNDSVPALRADWTPGHDGYVHPLNDHFHLEICPSKEGGMELIKQYRREMLEAIRDAAPDYVAIGGYDEGGCTCTACAPWGGNGHLRTVRELIPIYKEFFPNVRFILSAWQFGTYNQKTIEFDLLAEALKTDEAFRDVDYVISEPQYARYAYRPDVDMGRPLLTFPEISMYKMKPWGGYGANPLPKMLDNLWQTYGPDKRLAGCVPYSEGLYEDLNKILILRAYRDGQTSHDTIREYLAYETGLTGELLEKTAKAVEAMEETHERVFDRAAHTAIIVNPERVEEIEAAITEADAAMSEAARKNPRWRILLLRARVDGALKRAGFVRNAEVLSIYNELAVLCHLLEANGQSQRPDLDGDDDAGVYFVKPNQETGMDATPEEGRAKLKK